MKKPENREAERMVVAAALMDRECAGKAIELSYYDPRNAMLINAIKKLYFDNKEIELVSIRDTIEKSGGKLDVNYITEIVSDVTAPASFKNYVAILIETNEARRGWDILTNGLQRLGNGERGITDSIIQQLVSESDTTTDYTSALDAAIEACEYLEKINNDRLNNLETPFGIPYGIYPLDRITNGLHDEDLVIIAARPGEGKSAFATEMMLRISVVRANPKVGLLLSLEMTRTQNVVRMIANRTDIENFKLHGGYIKDWPRVLKEVNKIGAGKFHIANLAKNDIDTVLGSILRAKAKFGIDYAIVDYLQLVWGNGRTEYERVTNAVGQLKKIAQELQIPIIAPCQLNRASQKDISRSTNKDIIANPYPRLDDLRSSGAIEQDAGTVIFIHFNSRYKNPEDVPDNVPGKILIAKNRFGPTGSIPMEFQRPFLRFAIKEL